MLDEFAGNANDGAGFPDHPHRGFETVSYLLEGEFIHEVSLRKFPSFIQIYSIANVRNVRDRVYNF